MEKDKKEEEKQEGWYSTGTKFGITKERNIEIQDDIKQLFEKRTDIADIEQHVSDKYVEAGETYLAGFAVCYNMITERMKEENVIREQFWNFLLGIKKGVINPFGHAFPIELIEIIALGKDTTEGVRRSLEEYQKHLEKKQHKPEVA